MTASKTLEEEPYVWPKHTVITEDGSVLNGVTYIVWKAGDEHITLDAEDWTVRDLEAIAAHMRKHGA